MFPRFWDRDGVKLRLDLLGSMKNLPPWGQVIIIYQPVRYLFEVPSLFFMEFGDDIKEFLLVG
jgi:hypothetical protein